MQTVTSAKVEKSIDVRENDKDVREIDIRHLAEVLRPIDPFDFAPAVHIAQRIDITNASTSAEERGKVPCHLYNIFFLSLSTHQSLGQITPTAARNVY